MKYFFGLLLFVLTPNCASAAEIHNSQADFLLLLQNIPERGFNASWQEFEAKYQRIYDAAVFRLGTEGWEDKRQIRLDRFFQKLNTLKPGMLDLFARGDALVAEQEARVKQLFPDLPADIQVYLLPSLGSFNGKVMLLDGDKRPVLLLGIDVITERGDDLPTLFSHEFFHAYHFGRSPTGLEGRTMATPLWIEGFGTYVSGLLNPDRSDLTLLMDQELATFCERPEFRQSLAAQYLKVIGTDSGYDEWFKMNPDQHPSRRGYCLGLWALRKLGETYPLQEMVTWSETKFSPALQRALEELAR